MQNVHKHENMHEYVFYMHKYVLHAEIRIRINMPLYAKSNMHKYAQNMHKYTQICSDPISISLSDPGPAHVDRCLGLGDRDAEVLQPGRDEPTRAWPCWPAAETWLAAQAIAARGSCPGRSLGKPDSA